METDRPDSASTPAHAPWDAGLRGLFDDEYEGMIRLAFTLVGRVEDAEDAVQSAFLDVAHRFGEIRRPGAYLRTAVVSHCRSALRRREVADRPRPLLNRGPPEPSTELEDVLATLPERTRTAVVLRYYLDLDSTEIGALLDCPPATVRSILRRGLRRLKKELS